MTKFIILSTSRSGSNMLVSMLNCHTSINCEGEIIKGNIKNPINVAEKQFKTSKLCNGFKLFYYHEKGNIKFWDYLKSHTEIKIIHLIRDNLLDVYISRRLMDIGPCKITNSNERKTRSIKIDVKDCLNFFKIIENYKNTAKDIFKHHEVLDIKYQDLVDNKNITCNKILRFLDLQCCELKTDLLKQRIEPLSKIVINFEEVKDTLKNTQYSKFLPN